MRMARAMVLLLAACCAGAAALLVQRAATHAPKAALAAKPDRVDILVAARAIAIGEMVGQGETRWQAWPRDALPSGSIRRSDPAPGPAPARTALLEGEPVAEAKLLRPEHGGPLAVMLAPGMRAASVPMREETAAGGFIQPSDRVDVIVTRKSEQDAGRPRSQIVLRGARVLAIGKSLGGRAAAGSRSVTLELTPAQARSLADAEASGAISLALVGAADAGSGNLAAISAPEAAPGEVRLLKFGRSSGHALQ
jgi:pilus assembly protein CpaB